MTPFVKLFSLYLHLPVNFNLYWLKTSPRLVPDDTLFTFYVDNPPTPLLFLQSRLKSLLSYEVNTRNNEILGYFKKRKSKRYRDKVYDKKYNTSVLGNCRSDERRLNLLLHVDNYI